MIRRAVHGIVELGTGPADMAVARRRFLADPGRWLPLPATPTDDGHRVHLAMPRRSPEVSAIVSVGEPSVIMYHSHHMSLHQVLDGLAGSMIIGDYAALAGIDGVVDEQVMVTNDAGALGFTLNGKSFPATKPYTYTSGDKVIVHYYNEGLMAHPMHLHNQDGLVIAKDGYLLDDPYYMDTLNVAPGERYTVVYEMEQPGTWLWHCHVLSHVQRDDGSMFGMLTAVIVEEADTT